MIISKYYDIPNFIHDAGHKGAPYSFDGSHWLNHGELIEALYKAVLGYKPEKDANTSFCEGSDIPELNCSVKSSKATLTSVVLGENYATTKKVYFERVASSLWAWVDLKEDCLIAYTMNRDEFSDFMDEFSAYATDRKGIRFKAHSSKMEAWFSRRSRLNQAAHRVSLTLDRLRAGPGPDLSKIEAAAGRTSPKSKLSAGGRPPPEYSKNRSCRRTLVH